MKKTIVRHLYAVGVAALALVLTSCEDWLNLQPSTSTDTDNALKTVSDVENAMNGIYRLASAHSYYGDNYFYYGDCRAEDVQARVEKGAGRRVSPYYEYNALADDAFNIRLPWEQVYKVIRQTNNIIQKVNEGTVEVSSDDEAALLDELAAEALAMRAMAHYDLVRLYAMPYMTDSMALGVPIELQPELPTHRPARDTVYEVYTQVIKDLNDAVNGGLSRFKKDGCFNYWSAKALLSRVYLNKGDWRNAYEAAVDVIENNGGIYRLYTHDEYPTVWGQDFTTESLFEFYFTQTEPAGGSGGEGAPMVYADNVLDWNNLILTQAFLDLLDEDPDDVRHQLTKLPQRPEANDLPFLTDANGNQISISDRRIYLGKFPGKDGSGNTPQDNDLIILRLSEVYLNAAEAGFHLGGAEAEQGRAYLNEIVSRANPEKSVSSADFTLERILKERRKELVGEGLVFYDYLRNQKTISREGGWHLISLDGSSARTIAPNDLRIALPIPQSEIDANPNIKQNPR